MAINQCFIPVLCPLFLLLSLEGRWVITVYGPVIHSLYLWVGGNFNNLCVLA